MWHRTRWSVLDFFCKTYEKRNSPKKSNLTNEALITFQARYNISFSNAHANKRNNSLKISPSLNSNRFPHLPPGRRLEGPVRHRHLLRPQALLLLREAPLLAPGRGQGGGVLRGLGGPGDGRVLLAGKLEGPKRVLRVLHRVGAVGEVRDSPNFCSALP